MRAALTATFLMVVVAGLSAVTPCSSIAERVASSAPTSVNILLARNRTEPVVAVDPRHLSSIVAASNTNYGEPQASNYPAAYFTSGNSGRSFSFANAPVVAPYTTEADPSLAFDDNGTLFFSYLAETTAYCSTGSSAVLLTHSIDRGRSFRPARVVDANSADDKPNLAVETFPRAPSHIFVTWTRWHNSTSDVWFSRSIDGGVTFSPARMLFSRRGDSYGSVPAAAPEHHVYIFWSAFPDLGLSRTVPVEILMRSSSDDGAHFGPIRAVKRFTGIPQMAEPGALRSLSQAAVAVDAKGRLYLAWAQVSRSFGAGRVDADIEVSRSSNGGATWTAVHRVNDNRRNDRLMPALSMLADGSLGIAYYDRRNGPSELDVYAARVSFRGGFHHSANVRVNRASSPVADIPYIAPGSTCLAPGRFFGDYVGVAASGSKLAVVWTDTQLHVSGETDVWFARLALP